MRTNVYLRLVLIGVAMPVFFASAQRAEPAAAPGTRNANLEDVVAALFEHARSESGLQPLSRVHKSDVEKLVCTATILGTSGERPTGLHLNALFKTAEPDKISEDLRKLAGRRDRIGFRRFAVAVWTAQPSTDPVQYWIGFRLYMSPGAEFVENHFTDQVFYKDNRKEVVAPQCKSASAKP
jgi:hypothetical protein